MDHKEDLRIRKTKHAVKMAFLDLLERKTLEQITVKEITDLALCNRNTFYLHYLDKEDLMEKLCQECVEDFEKAVSSGVNIIDSAENEGFKLNAAAIADSIESHMAIYHAMIGRNRSPNFSEMIKETIRAHIFIGLKDTASELKALSLQCEYTSGGIAAIIAYWIKHQDSFSKLEFVTELARITQKETLKSNRISA